MDELNEPAPVSDLPTTESAPPSEDGIRSSIAETHDRITGTTPETSDKVHSADVPSPVQQTIAPPQSWGPQHHKYWSTLNPEVQKLISQRELESHQRITELGRASGDLGRIYESYKSSLPPKPDGSPMRPDEAFHFLLHTAHQLQANPVGTLTGLARHLGVNLAGEQVGSLQQQTALLQQRMQAEAQQRQQYLAHRHQVMGATVQKFWAERPYMAQIEHEVRDQMRLLLAKDPGRNQVDPLGLLQEAHDRALALVPGVKDAIDAPRREATAKEKAAEAKKRAEEAKRLGQLNVRSRGGSLSPLVKGKTLRASMEEAFERIQGR